MVREKKYQRIKMCLNEHRTLTHNETSEIFNIFKNELSKFDIKHLNLSQYFNDFGDPDGRDRFEIRFEFDDDQIMKKAIDIAEKYNNGRFSKIISKNVNESYYDIIAREFACNCYITLFNKVQR